MCIVKGFLKDLDSANGSAGSGRRKGESRKSISAGARGSLERPVQAGMRGKRLKWFSRLPVTVGRALAPTTVLYAWQNHGDRHVVIDLCNAPQATEIHSLQGSYRLETKGNQALSRIQ